MPSPTNTAAAPRTPTLTELLDALVDLGLLKPGHRDELAAKAAAQRANVVRLRPRSAGCSGLPPPSSRESSAKRRPRPCGVVETTICYIASAG